MSERCPNCGADIVEQMEEDDFPQFGSESYADNCAKCHAGITIEVDDGCNVEVELQHD